MNAKDAQKRRQIRILIVRFGSVAGTIGGGTIRLIQVTRRWQKECSVFVMTHETTYLWQKYLGLVAQPFHLVNARWTWTQNIPSLLYCMVRNLFLRTNEKFDVVMSRSEDLVDVIPSIWLAKQTGAKLTVYAGTDIIPSAKSRKKLLRMLVLVDHFLSCLLLRWAADIVNPFNEQSRDELINLGINPKKLIILFGGFNWEDINKIPSQEKQYEAIYLGRISPEKGSNDLIDAWRLVCNVFPKARLAIAGTGEPNAIVGLHNRIKENDLENNVVFLGYIEESVKYQVLKASKIFILPSYVDTFSYSVAEALACELPVITYKTKVFQSVYGDAIVYAKFGNISSLMQKIILLLQNQDMREVYGKKGRESVVKYDWDNAARFELGALKKIVSQQNN